MGTLRIRRVDESINMLRAYKILVNGQPVGKVDNGGVLDLPLEPGVHQVSAKIDWCASPPMSVTIASGGVVELELGCNEGVWGGLGLLIALVFQSQKFLYLRTPLMPSM